MASFHQANLQEIMTSEAIEAFFQNYWSAAAAMDAEALASMHHTPRVRVHTDGRIECLLTHDTCALSSRTWAGSMRSGITVNQVEATCSRRRLARQPCLLR